jgi:hypothetical protein
MSGPLRLKLPHGHWYGLSTFLPIPDGAHRGTGDITPHTGIHGVHPTGIITTDITITGTITIMVITDAGITIAIQGGTTFIILPKDHIHMM